MIQKKCDICNDLVLVTYQENQYKLCVDCHRRVLQYIVLQLAQENDVSRKALTDISNSIVEACIDDYEDYRALKYNIVEQSVTYELTGIYRLATAEFS